MKKATRRSHLDVEMAVAELVTIKRLLILQLLAAGIQSSQIASALGVDKSVVSRLVSARGIKGIVGRKH